MGIRETLAALPKAGSVKEVPTESLGIVRVKYLSMSEMLELPEKDAGLHLVATAILDESGKPLFKSIAEINDLPAAAGLALMNASNSVNTSSLVVALNV
jgi:hypothetical protein